MPAPPATPTVRNGRVYTLGATGTVNALDARNGDVVWSRNAATDTGKQVPDWGFASSPLVIDDLVIIAVAGQLVAYDVRTGNPRWFGPPEGGGYSSPHLMTIDDILASIDLEDGKRKWKGGRYGHGQLVLLPDQDVLLVLSEEGELALVGATPDQFRELARFPALEGKLEPPGTGERCPAGSQRPGDGRVPAVPRGPLTRLPFAAIVGAAQQSA